MAKISRLALMRLTSGGGQNFLGARWVPLMVRVTPTKWRESVVLRLLATSPHYIYDSDIAAEADRNRVTREDLVAKLIAPHVTTTSRVLDFGCGPGYAAAATASRVSHVDAIDVSPGVIACAEVLNQRNNIDFTTTAEFQRGTAISDVAYTFAVLQHLDSATLDASLDLIHDHLVVGGTLLAHFATADDGWTSEAEWKASADQSWKGSMRLKYGLNCFGRSDDEMKAIVERHGFRVRECRSLVSDELVDPDISRQMLLIAERVD